MSAAIDICLRRALKAPCTWATCVVSVRTTTTLDASAVRIVMVSPLRPVISPSALADWAAAVPQSNKSVASEITKTITATLFLFMIPPDVCAVSAFDNQVVKRHLGSLSSSLTLQKIASPNDGRRHPATGGKALKPRSQYTHLFAVVR